MILGRHNRADTSANPCGALQSSIIQFYGNGRAIAWKNITADPERTESAETVGW
jgi:hypothetical protein